MAGFMINMDEIKIGIDSSGSLERDLLDWVIYLPVLSNHSLFDWVWLFAVWCIYV